MSGEKGNRDWIAWFEIPVTNFARGKRFYENIFSISLESKEFGPLKMGLFPDAKVSGAIVEHEAYTPAENGPLIYLDCGADLKEVEERVKNAGGQVLMEKKQISEEHGFMALIRDSEGNRVALWSKK